MTQLKKSRWRQNERSCLAPRGRAFCPVHPFDLRASDVIAPPRGSEAATFAGKSCCRTPGNRAGLTLLEVLLSLGLFLGALAALSQLWYGGVRAAVQARLTTQAILRCESKLNEVVAGAVSLVSTGDTPFEDDAEWTWSLQVEAGSHADTRLVTVKVVHPGQGGMSASEYQLRRLIRDPQLWTEAQQATTSEETTSP